MKFFRRRSESPAESSVPNLALIEEAMRSWANSKNVEMETEEDTRVMIALTMAAAIPAKLAVEQSPTLTRLWGKGDEEKAGRLLAAWFIGVAFDFAVRSNPDADPRTVVEAWKPIAGHWITDKTWAVNSLAEQYLRDQELFKAGGIPTSYSSLLVIMSAIALGATVDSDNVTFPRAHHQEILDILIDPALGPNDLKLEVSLSIKIGLGEAVNAIPGFIEVLKEDRRL